MLEGLAVVPSSSKCIVHHERHSLCFTDLGNPFKIWHIVTWIANGLYIDTFGLVVNGLLKIGWSLRGQELGVNAQARQEHFELVVGPAIQVGRRNDVVARVCQSRDGHELGRLPRRGADCGQSTLQCRYSLLKHIHGRVHDPTVDVAKLFEAKQTGAMGRIIEGEGG